MKDNEALLKKQKAESLIRKMVRVNEQVHEPSPYRGLTGIVVDVRTNVEKTGETYPICIVRLDKPIHANFKEIGVLPDALDEVLE